MAQQLIVTMVVILTGISAISILFGMLLLTSIALNKVFPVRPTGNKPENEYATPPQTSTQVDEETVAVIQAAITMHLRRSPQ